VKVQNLCDIAVAVTVQSTVAKTVSNARACSIIVYFSYRSQT
jgi:hypothetical protein